MKVASGAYRLKAARTATMIQPLPKQQPALNGNHKANNTRYDPFGRWGTVPALAISTAKDIRSKYALHFLPC